MMKRTVLPIAAALAALAGPAALAQSAGPAPLETIVTNPNCKGGAACEEHTAVFAAPLRQNGEGHRDVETQEVRTYGPSINFGNAGGWTVTHVLAPHVVFGTSGIDQYMEGDITKNGTGDLAGLYFYVYGGGRAAQSDEGVTGITVESGEIGGYFHGTIASGGAKGATALALTRTANAPHNWDATCDGCMLLDISKGTIAGRLNGRSQPFGKTYLNQLPTTAITLNGAPAKLPLTQAWCAAQVAIPPTATAGVGTARTFQCTLGAIGNGTPAFKPGIVTIAGPAYPEQAQLVSVGSPSGGVQTLTLLARNPNDIGALIFQGGIAGQSLSFDDNLAFSGFRSSYYAFGSVDGVNLIYGSQIAGSVVHNLLPRLGSEPEQPNSGFHLYPSAEIVANTQSPAAPMLEPNNVDWANGDAVENPRFQSFGGIGMRDVCSVYTPSDQGVASGCLLVALNGPGISGTYRPMRLDNMNPFSLYGGYGGSIVPPVALTVSGPFMNMIMMDSGPATGGAVVHIGNTANRDGKPFNLFNLPSTGGPNAAQVVYDPAKLQVQFPQGILAGSLATRVNCTGTNCNGAMAGSFAIPAGANSVTVADSAITPDSQILITPDASLDARLSLTCNKNPSSAFAPFGVLARVPGRSFTVGIAAAGSAPNCYSYTIVN